MNRLTHVLVLLPSTRFGGTEGHSAQLAARLATQAGLRVTLAAEPALLPALSAALPADLPSPTLRAAAIGSGDTSPAEAARQRAAAAALIEELAPDLLLLPLPWPNAGLGLMQAGADLPRLIVLHLAPDGPAPPGIAEALPELALDGAAWCAVSAPGARRAERMFGLRPGFVAQIDNPAPAPPRAEAVLVRAALRRALGLSATDPLLLFVGRLERAKGAHLLAEIATAADMTLACAGAGPLRAELDRKAAADPARRLRMLGQLADPTAWYQAADALLLPSTLEGLPLVFLEAAAAQCPVIATEAALEGLGSRAASLARLVPEPTPQAFATAAREVLGDPAGTMRLVRLAQAEAARRSWDRILPEWLGLLRAASASHHASRLETTA
ncbi:glycosyltransferase family 4 protein [Roseomonas sp. F4]